MYTAMVSCLRFILITNFSDQRSVFTANLFHTKQLPNPLHHKEHENNRSLKLETKLKCLKKSIYLLKIFAKKGFVYSAPCTKKTKSFFNLITNMGGLYKMEEEGSITRQICFFIGVLSSTQLICPTILPQLTSRCLVRKFNFSAYPIAEYNQLMYKNDQLHAYVDLKLSLPNQSLLKNSQNE